MRLPDFLGIGAQRCGTTTLWELLRRHHGTFLPSIKELHYFDNRDGLFERDIESYSRYFHPAPPESKCGEISPSYLYIDESCQRIRDLLPHVRLLVILRNPVSRAWSHYWNEVMQGQEWLSFERALDAERTRLESGSLFSRIHWSYVARGRYVEQLRRYERTFPRDQICVLFLDTLVREPESTMRRVYEHIDVEPPDDPGVYQLTHEHERDSHARVVPFHFLATGVWRRIGRGDGLARRAARTVVEAAVTLNKKTGKPSMTEATRNRLEETFYHDNLRLADWLGESLPWTASR